jgi:hypothetical protein
LGLLWATHEEKQPTSNVQKKYWNEGAMQQNLQNKSDGLQPGYDAPPDMCSFNKNNPPVLIAPYICITATPASWPNNMISELLPKAWICPALGMVHHRMLQPPPLIMAAAAHHC